LEAVFFPQEMLESTNTCYHSYNLWFEVCFLFHQDQLSADMYSFVAKEIDYASYYQTVSATSVQAVT